MKTDKASGIVNDANRYAAETVGDPVYPLKLFQRVITVSASKEGLTWIGRSLWRATGDANRLGPYMAWAPRRYSWRNTAADMQRQIDKSNDLGLTFDTSEMMLTGQENTTQFEFAAAVQANNVPLSIFEKPAREQGGMMFGDS